MVCGNKLTRIAFHRKNMQKLLHTHVYMDMQCSAMQCNAIQYNNKFNNSNEKMVPSESWPKCVFDQFNFYRGKKNLWPMRNRNQSMSLNRWFLHVQNKNIECEVFYFINFFPQILIDWSCFQSMNKVHTFNGLRVLVWTLLSAWTFQAIFELSMLAAKINTMVGLCKIGYEFDMC